MREVRERSPRWKEEAGRKEGEEELKGGGSTAGVGRKGEEEDEEEEEEEEESEDKGGNGDGKAKGCISIGGTGPGFSRSALLGRSLLGSIGVSVSATVGVVVCEGGVEVVMGSVEGENTGGDG